MFSKRWYIGVLAVMASASFAVAQEPGGDEPRDQPPQREGRERPEGRERGRERARFGGRGIEQQVKAITEQLKLDEQQQTSVKGLVEAHTKKMQELQEANRPSPEEMEKNRGLRQAMREAREANDEAKIAELEEATKGQRERMVAMREKMESLNKELHDSLVAVMHDDQKEAFEKAWTERMVQRRRPMQVDPRQLKRVVDGLDGLSTQQKEQIQTLFTAHLEKSRELAEKERELAQANRKLYDDVMAVLDETQKAKVEREFQPRGGERGRFGRDREGSDRPRRRERPAPGENP